MGRVPGRIVGAAAVVLVLVMAGVGVAGGSPPSSSPGPGARSHVVVLRQGSDAGAVSAEHDRASDVRVDRVYRHALQGYSATMAPAAAARLARDPRVASVEVDQVVTIAQDPQVTPTGVRRIFADQNSAIGIDGVDDVRVDVDVAVLDTGIDHTHPDLHVVARVDCTATSGGPPWNRTSTCVSGGTDRNGHGTHVAGTIAAIDDGQGVVGVAPGARLTAVKVLSDSGSGSISGIVAGIDWVTAQGSIEVANMSLGCECSSAALDAAITSSVAAGVTHVVAAGNNAKDASTFSPANHPDVITVSALADFDGQPGGSAPPTCRTDADDTRANFSNFGALVEVAAPGVCIRSTWPGGGYNTISGTSMASPHAAGAAALLASTGGRSPAQIRTTLISSGNLDWTLGADPGPKEPLLDVRSSTFAPRTVPGSGVGDGGETDGGTGGDSSPPPPPPDDLTLSATGTKVKGSRIATLSWSGSTAAGVDVYRDQTLVATVTNTGSYTEDLGKGGGGTLTYRVCETGTQTCSNEATASF